MPGGTIRRWTGTAFLPAPGAALVPWTPDLLTGMKLWLKADAMTGYADGDPVATWEDASASSHDGYQPTPANRPTYRDGVRNGLPGVQFDGNDGLDLTNMGTQINADSSYTLFFLSRPLHFSDAPVIFTYPTEGTWTWLVEWEPAGGVYWGHGNPTYNVYAAGVTAGSFPLMALNKSSSSAQSFRRDGSEVGVGTSNAGGTGPTPAMSGAIRMGAYSGHALGITGEMLEVLYFDYSLSNTQVELVEGYLAHKWALQTNLPPAHPYKDDAPTAP